MKYVKEKKTDDYCKFTDWLILLVVYVLAVYALATLL